MLERVLKIIELDNLTMSDFAKKIGVQSSQVSHIKNGRNQVTLDFVTKILIAYPNIDSDWLLFGKGSMYKNDKQTTDNQSDNTKKQVSQPEMLDLFSGVPYNDPKESVENELTNTPETEDPKVSEITVETETAEEKKSEVKINEAKTNEEPHVHETPRQSVKKIVVLYSDKTYEEFIPNPN